MAYSPPPMSGGGGRLNNTLAYPSSKVRLGRENMWLLSMKSEGKLFFSWACGNLTLFPDNACTMVNFSSHCCFSPARACFGRIEP